MIETVFFDIDGTLVDSNEFHVVAWDEVLRDAGYRVARSVVREQIGQGADILVPSLIPNISHHEHQELTRAHGEIFKSRFLQRVRAFDRASDLIHELAASGKTILLVSSSDEKEIAHYARLLKIETTITATVTSDDVKSTKPAGDLFAVALRKSGVLPKNAIAVGDTPYDIAAASKNGITSIALLSGGFTQSALGGAREIYINVGDLYDNLQNSELKSG